MVHLKKTSRASRPTARVVSLVILFVLLCTLVLGCNGTSQTTDSSDTTDSSGLSSSSTPSTAAALSWSQVETAEGPPAGAGHTMVYDSQRGLLFLSGFYFTPSAETTGQWEESWYYDSDKATWTKEQIEGSVPRVGAPSPGTIYDAQLQKPLLFTWSGSSADLALLVWNYDGARHQWSSSEQSWSSSGVSGEAPISVVAAAAYDSQNMRTVYFGGVFASGDETWAFDSSNNTWTKQDPLSAPPSRYYASLVYDSLSGKFILFGGWGEGGALNDTWSYDLQENQWTNLNPSGPLPPGRGAAAMVFDTARNKVILFGGSASGELPSPRPPLLSYSVLGDTWEYDPVANTWTELTTSGPPARAFSTIAYDEQGEKIVLFGGYGAEGLLGDTWTLEP